MEKNTDKTDLIGHALGFLNISPSKVIMVGDRKYDIIGAKENLVKTIGVLWGYGTKFELEGTEPDYLVKTPEELTKTILSLTT